ncbi:hypothetical protein BDR22DRAFT_352440 [Usnea florida]
MRLQDECEDEKTFLEDDSEDEKTFLEDDSDSGIEMHAEESRSSTSHKTESGPQETLMSSGDTEYSYKRAPQYSPDGFSVTSSLDVGTSEKVTRLIGDLRQRTGAAMDPQEAVNLIAEASGDDQLALRRYFSAGLPATSILPGIPPTPHEPPRWPPPGAVQGTYKLRGTDEGLKNSSEESEKKRCGLAKVFRRRKGISRG